MCAWVFICWYSIISLFRHLKVESVAFIHVSFSYHEILLGYTFWLYHCNHIVAKEPFLKCHLQNPFHFWDSLSCSGHRQCDRSHKYPIWLDCLPRITYLSVMSFQVATSPIGHILDINIDWLWFLSALKFNSLMSVVVPKAMLHICIVLLVSVVRWSLWSFSVLVQGRKQGLISNNIHIQSKFCFEMNSNYRSVTIQWRHMSHGFSKHQKLGGFLNTLFQLTSKKISKLCITGPLWRIPSASGGITHKGQ